jgi:mannose-6-phosphate isomerase-like protein (cupin superfamily)
MKVTKNEAKLIKREHTTVYSYPPTSKAISVAFIEVKERHPAGKKEQFIEHDLHVLFYIIDGSGTVTVENKPYELTKGDVLTVQPGQRYFIEGDLSYVATTSPAYYSDQNEVVNN